MIQYIAVSFQWHDTNGGGMSNIRQFSCLFSSVLSNHKENIKFPQSWLFGEVNPPVTSGLLKVSETRNVLIVMS